MFAIYVYDSVFFLFWSKYYFILVKLNSILQLCVFFVGEMEVVENQVLIPDMNQRITKDIVGLRVKKNMHHHTIIS